jgi:hypothetical protein
MATQAGSINEYTDDSTHWNHVKTFSLVGVCISVTLHTIDIWLTRCSGCSESVLLRVHDLGEAADAEES